MSALPSLARREKEKRSKLTSNLTFLALLLLILSIVTSGPCFNVDCLCMMYCCLPFSPSHSVSSRARGEEEETYSFESDGGAESRVTRGGELGCCFAGLAFEVEQVLQAVLVDLFGVERSSQPPQRFA